MYQPRGKSTNRLLRATTSRIIAGRWRSRRVNCDQVDKWHIIYVSDWQLRYRNKTLFPNVDGVQLHIGKIVLATPGPKQVATLVEDRGVKPAPDVAVGARSLHVTINTMLRLCFTACVQKLLSYL